MILLNPIDLIMLSYWRRLLLVLVKENGQSGAGGWRVESSSQKDLLGRGSRLRRAHVEHHAAGHSTVLRVKGGTPGAGARESRGACRKQEAVICEVGPDIMDPTLLGHG